VAAYEAGFHADPTGDCDYAEAFGNEKSDGLNRISALRAKTPKGLSAKARVVPWVIKSGCGTMEDRDAHFFESFARDVRDLLEPIINGRADIVATDQR
jgi:hypothetical protein